MGGVVDYVKHRVGSKGLLNVASAVSRTYFGGAGAGVLSELARLSYRRQRPHIQLIQIQTQAGCNYTCSFCPVGKITLPGGRMSMELYEHVLAQLGDFRGELRPYLMNEPLLDKRIVELCRLARERTRARAITIQTNGSRLTREMAEELVRYATIIVNDYTEDNSVLARLRSYGIRSKNLILVDRDPHATLSNRAGNVPGRPVVRLRQFCVRPFTQVYVTSDGKLVLCCQDWKFEEVMGDLRQHTLAEIWNNERYRQLRTDLLSRNRTGLCSKCDFPGI